MIRIVSGARFRFLIMPERSSHERTRHGACRRCRRSTRRDRLGQAFQLTLFGAEHSLGGITGYDLKETTDENPERVALIQRLTWAYLRTALDPADSSWPAARAALTGGGSRLGRIESR
jgi:hypothetical protein